MKSKTFKTVNGIMAVFCAGTMYMNHIGVNILNTDSATSIVGNDIFEYQSTENEFSVHKNGKLIGKVPLNKKMTFKSNKPLLQCNAVVVAGKIIAAGFAAAAAGSTFAAGASAAMAGALEAVGVASVAVGAACVEIPGAAAVAATVGGAGEVAAAAAAAEAAVAAGSGMAVLMSILVPVLIGAGIGAGLA